MCVIWLSSIPAWALSTLETTNHGILPGFTKNAREHSIAINSLFWSFTGLNRYIISLISPILSLPIRLVCSFNIYSFPVELTIITNSSVSKLWMLYWQLIIETLGITGSGGLMRWWKIVRLSTDYKSLVFICGWSFGNSSI